MKKNTFFFAALLLFLCLAVCGCNVREIDIDYGNSDIFSRSDMDAAIELIKNELATRDGCELHSISYSSDECNSEKNIIWMNDLSKENAEFTQCIEFYSDFHSPKAGGGAWNADYEYTNWQWWFARTESGEWNLMTWGY